MQERNGQRWRNPKWSFRFMSPVRQRTYLRTTRERPSKTLRIKWTTGWKIVKRKKIKLVLHLSNFNRTLDGQNNIKLEFLNEVTWQGWFQTPEWTDEDLSLLTRCMVKFPGGTPGRWEKIAHELGRSVADVGVGAVHWFYYDVIYIFALFFPFFFLSFHVF